MTPKELYDWAVENDCEHLDIVVNGVAIDYNPPIVDLDIDCIDIETPRSRW